MRKTIYSNPNPDITFKVYNNIYNEYKDIYNKNPPAMFVGIETKLVKYSENIWIISVEGEDSEVKGLEQFYRELYDLN